MIIIKKKYFFIIESIKTVNLDNIKNINKFNIIYRTNKIIDDRNDLFIFRKKCKEKRIKFYIANNLNLVRNLKPDGIYISAYNKNLKFNYFKNLNLDIIGSAHNIHEINLKKKQGCTTIFLSRLFETHYKDKNSYMGLIKYNLFPIKKNISPLGGISRFNLKKLKNVRSVSFALSSAFNKDNSINRLFY